MENCTITLQFRGIHPTSLEDKRLFQMYHYITVPGHPSDYLGMMQQFRLRVPLHYSSGASIRQSKTIYWRDWCTITLQFRGIHPTSLHVNSANFLIVPLHYSSGASIRQNWSLIRTGRKYHYITVPGHPSDEGANFRGVNLRYHYITVPGHPSD